MKKTSYFLLLLALCSTLSLQAKQTIVKTATTLITVFTAAQNGDTVLLAPGTYNVSNKLYFPASGVITVKSQYPDIPDSIATLQMNMQGQNIATGNSAGLIFESINLQHNNPTATSGHIIYINKFYGNISKLIFRNCDISNGVRGLFRSVKPTDASYTSCGDLDYLEMTNCKIHNTFISSGNSWPLLYLGHLPLEVNISNNTFYDLAYMKNIFTMNYADPNSGRNAKIAFKNNTVCTTATGNFIATSNYLGEETEFDIENNIFIRPSWSNALNPDTSVIKTNPSIISCKGGIITAKNNLVKGPKSWISGQTLDTEGQGGFVVIDTTNTYSFADMNFDWTDFADPERGDYSNLSTKKLATSGVAGAPIGDPRWVKTFTNPRILTVAYSPETMTATVTPRRAFYENGSSVTVKASVVDGYNFSGWKNAADNSIVSTSNPYTFNITSDLNLVATYSLLVERKVSVTVNGSKSATYTITPSKATYYEGDQITIALNKHNINDFIGWSDNNTDLTRTITISGSDIALTANFTEHPYLLCWDFDQLATNNNTFTNLAANHASDAVNKGIMNYMSADTLSKISTRNNKFTTEGKELHYCVTRKTPIANVSNPDYVFIKFSTKGITDLKVKSIIATDNSFFKVQKLQYSLNGTQYTTFATDTISGNIDQVWRSFEGVLPDAAENQDTIYVRWISDPSTEQLFVTGVTSYEVEQIYIANIIVINSNFSATNNVMEDNMYKIYSAADKLYINSDVKATAELYSMMGQKVKDIQLNAGVNVVSGIDTGVYIVRIGSQVQKILIK